MVHILVVLYAFFSLVTSSSLVGVYQPTNIFTNLRSLYLNGSVIPNSDIAIPKQPNDYYNAGGAFDSLSNTYSYSISENGASIMVVHADGSFKNVTLPCSPKCAMVWCLTSYEGKLYGYATTPQVDSTGGSLYAFSFDLQKFTTTGFWYSIPQPYFIWVWGVQAGVSVVNGKTNIYTLLYNTTNPKIVFPTFAHLTTVCLETQTVTIQTPTISIDRGNSFVYDYSDNSLWSISTSSLIKLDISNPTVTTAVTVYSSGYSGLANGVLDLPNQKYYTLALGIWDAITFLVYDLATKNTTTFLLFDNQSSIINLSLAP